MQNVIIVGSRCAGASLAYFLGELGYRVLLLDKFKSPKDPVLSTHILGGEEIYDDLKIRQKIDKCGSPIIKRMKIDYEGHVFESDIVVTSRVIGIRREILDNLLFQQAANNPNVEIRTSATVQNVIYDNNKIIGVTYKDAQGNFHEEYAGVVIGADGRNSLIARKVKAKVLLESEELHSVYYTYVKGLKPMPLPTFEWFWHKQGVILINPIDSSLHCIALILPNETKPQEVKDTFIDMLSEVKTLKPRLQNVKLAKPVKGLKNIKNFIKNSYGHGWVLVGDASNHLHPISGIGIDNAVNLARYLSIQLDCFFKGEKSWADAMEDYQLFRDEQIIPQYQNSLRTLQYTKELPGENTNFYSSMLCTFPSYIKKLCLNSESILEKLRGEL
ncbi:NAD(P)/FAD-dependent oxidoreductase [Bacillus sp. 166amftsu]|uniref:NAD(P)/FAD-dependent oxidoreductase n=1 Tax=Bacillus sp. 166amftsu TaxID=1761753 RepID=UPI00089B69D8|nr:NAD(P)/FAD-dependent oxidoreductase [Bacillus sp. 166amftsu]SDZ37785.1 2-polyprenyl-6-methoxyphenol hydroxylase [Bacillus sp. 166amftsu]